MKKNEIAVVFVRGEDGKINVGATLQAATEAIQGRADAEEKVSGLVNQVFDMYPGVKINQDALCSKVCELAKVSIGQYTEFKSAVVEYLQENDQGKKDDSGEEHPGSLFVMTKGKGGGYVRRSDTTKRK